MKGKVAFPAWPLNLARSESLSRNCLGVGQRMLQLEGTRSGHGIIAVKALILQMRTLRP